MFYKDKKFQSGMTGDSEKFQSGMTGDNDVSIFICIYKVQTKYLQSPNSCQMINPRVLCNTV